MDKQCNKCSETKSLNEFYKNPNVKDGRQGHCKKCHTNMLRKPQAKYRDRMVAGVYGIFSGQTCLYVGQSCKLTDRISAHKTHVAKPLKNLHEKLYVSLRKHPNLEYKILEETPNHKEQEKIWIEYMNPLYNSYVLGH